MLLSKRLLPFALVAVSMTSQAVAIESFGEVERIAVDRSGILVAGVGGTFCFTSDALADESVAAMTAVLAGAVANELDIQPATLNSAWMVCDAGARIQQIGVCRAGVNPATGNQCF